MVCAYVITKNTKQTHKTGGNMHFEKIRNGFKIINNDGTSYVVDQEQLNSLLADPAINLQSFFTCPVCGMEENFTGSEIIDGQRICYSCLSGFEGE